MPKVKILNDCEVCEGSAPLIKFKKGDVVQISDGLMSVLKVGNNAELFSKPAKKPTPKKETKTNEEG